MGGFGKKHSINPQLINDCIKDHTLQLPPPLTPPSSSSPNNSNCFKSSSLFLVLFYFFIVINSYQNIYFHHTNLTEPQNKKAHISMYKRKLFFDLPSNITTLSTAKSQMIPIIVRDIRIEINFLKAPPPTEPALKGIENYIVVLCGEQIIIIK